MSIEKSDFSSEASQDENLNSQLATILDQLAQTDRAARVAWEQGAPFNPEIDQKNNEALEKIIDTYGWPGKSLVGEKGAENAWLLAQHADTELQKRILPLLERALLKQEAKKIHMIYLLDRVMTNTGKEQLFGTQALYESDDSGNNKKVDVPLVPDNPQNLQSIGQRVGLAHLPDYYNELKAAYDEYERQHKEE